MAAAKTVSAIYLAFLLISVVPIFADALTDHSGDQYHSWGLDFFGAVHILFVNPIVNFLGIAALFAQARILMAQTPGSGLGALSLYGAIFTAETSLGRLVARLSHCWEIEQFEVC
ncbi:hypothetical protein N657DRAFT_637930 [Parathielavia appendiculata]|uniref:Uncharacterized protein n=1 Tax=Parathielavia appendiculata TaxID=2587402 RepID=A0AAN6TR45_9PEZI|nr:hypothetical protein N657DRAFT_637930 [Parathielavia appendiculata]